MASISATIEAHGVASSATLVDACGDWPGDTLGLDGQVAEAEAEAVEEGIVIR
ncbi:hypothetical protein ACPWR0_11305 [Pandoraea pneumonica]|uniref:hypothetical protein n=1 Tax=Pandoraea pneumonica TaxID=2508299 RepID=UPI003CE86472